MKRTKQLETIISNANKYFENNRITETSNDLFLFLTSQLLALNCYRGFNYYVHREIKDGPYKGIQYLALAGTGEPGRYDCLQIM